MEAIRFCNNVSRLLLFTVLVFSLHPDSTYADDPLYLCPPCGCDADGTVFETAGRCPSCNMKLIAEDQHINESPKPSPDGKKVAFISTRDDDMEIYVMDVNGDNVLRLTKSEFEDEHIAWSPDSKKIAFSSKRDGEQSDIYIMNADGSEQINLTKSNIREIHPSFSPDGEQIVYAGRDGDEMNIYVMSRDGSNRRQITEHAFGNAPRWTPEAREIIFFNRDDQEWNPYKINLDGTEKSQVKNLPRRCDISADGSRIIFPKRGEDRNSEIYIIKSDGSGEQQLTNTPGFDNSNPVWSHDGEEIYFNSDRDGQSEIYVMNADGSEQMRLTTQ